MANTSEPAEPRPNFEEALTELQQTVADLEGGSLGLEEALERFERGMTLLRGCYQLLEHAEQRIQILTGTDADGNPVSADFDATATHDPAQRRAGRRARRAAETPAAESDAAEDDENEAASGRRLF